MKKKNQPEEEYITGFKGYEKDLKCRGHQYKVGKEYETDEKVKACESGFHFCEYPLDVFGYYNPGQSKFTEVIGSGQIDKNHEDSKVACSKIKIGAEISIKSLVKAALKFTFDKVKWEEKNSTSGYYSGASTSGYYSGASTSGDYSGASTSGYYSGASTSGYYSGASTSGYYSGASTSGYKSGASTSGDYSNVNVGEGCVGMAVGLKAKAKGKKGSWIVLTECEQRNYITYVKDVKSFAVDGAIIKEDTFYILEKGEAVETL